MIHASMTEAVEKIEAALKEAESNGLFMSAVWFVDDKGTLHCRRTTWQFQIGRMTEAKEMLGKMIDEELNPSRTPLPLASFLISPALSINWWLITSASAGVSLRVAMRYWLVRMRNPVFLRFKWMVEISAGPTGTGVYV
jgi:hypothetical protein